MCWTISVEIKNVLEATKLPFDRSLPGIRGTEHVSNNHGLEKLKNKLTFMHNIRKSQSKFQGYVMRKERLKMFLIYTGQTGCMRDMQLNAEETNHNIPSKNRYKKNNIY